MDTTPLNEFLLSFLIVYTGTAIRKIGKNANWAEVGLRTKSKEVV